jgi:hypothetical protein
MPRFAFAPAFVACLAAAAAVGQAPGMQSVRNQGDRFRIELPAGWRQIAPNEARRLGENPAAHRDLTYVEPRLFYAFGPVDRWLGGDLSGPWLFVVEQDSEWLVGDDFEPRLQAMWAEKGVATGCTHRLRDVQTTTVGAAAYEAITAVRTSEGPPGAPATTSLDVYAPAGGQQFTFCFTCASAEFAQFEPEFRRWLATLTFARRARGEPKLGDRLWTPMIVGAVVGIVLLVLYKHSKARR